MLVTGATANVDGYYSELERTMFVGEASDEDEHYFELACEAQETAFEAMGPGVPVSHVDEAVSLACSRLPGRSPAGHVRRSYPFLPE